MRFYTQEHRYYCGIDLHARSMYVCILDQEGKVVLHKNMRAGPEPFLKAIGPFRKDLAVAAECIFTWYWLADLCAQEEIPFVLGHALYMKAIHGGKAKNDRIDSRKIAGLLRSGMIPQSLRLSPEDALDPGSPAPPLLLGSQANRSVDPYPEHQQPIQPA